MITLDYDLDWPPPLEPTPLPVPGPDVAVPVPRTLRLRLHDVGDELVLKSGGLAAKLEWRTEDDQHFILDIIADRPAAIWRRNQLVRALMPDPPIRGSLTLDDLRHFIGTHVTVDLRIEVHGGDSGLRRWAVRRYHPRNEP